MNLKSGREEGLTKTRQLKDPYDLALGWIVKRWGQISPRLFVFAVLLTIGTFWFLWATSADGIAVWLGVLDRRDNPTQSRGPALGAWGDSFGGFNALFGALGFAAVTITLILQYKSYLSQRRDQHIERFEENFFRLIDLMRALRLDITYEQTPRFQKERPDYSFVGRRTGYSAIEAAYREVNHWVFKAHHGRKEMSRTLISSQYNNYVHHRFESCFAPYYRIIYTILYRIKNDKILSEGQKFDYGNLLRSQLTSFEIGMLAFNATSKYSKDLLELVEYFRLLKYLPKKRRRVLGKVFRGVAYAQRT